MTREEISNEYFEWIYRTFCDDRSYIRLFTHLYNSDFAYTLDKDGNRYEDGIDLRYRFAREIGYNHRIISSKLNIFECSVLEMMAALAIRIEEHIMDDPAYGDRTAKWFWGMMDSLGLSYMTNDEFNSDICDSIVNRLMSNDYDKNGDGGLFTIPNFIGDLRNVEIWYQACWYLNSLEE